MQILGSAKEMLDFIKQRFKIRQCRNYLGRTRPCLNYHIKRCDAPCMGYISKEEYAKQIEEIIHLLEGKTGDLIRDLDGQIKEAASKLEFEKAAYLRDKKIAIERISEKQKVSNLSENNIDVIGLARNEYEACIEIFFVRGSKMIRREHYFFENLEEMSEQELISGFIKQYYMNHPDLPNKIMIKEEIEDKDVIEEWLSSQAGRKVIIKVPQKGEKLRFVEMAQMNSSVTLENKYSNGIKRSIKIRKFTKENRVL